MSKAQRKRKWRERQDSGLEGETRFEAQFRRLTESLGIPERVLRGSSYSTYSHFLHEEIREREERYRRRFLDLEVWNYLAQEYLDKSRGTSLLKYVPEFCPVCLTHFSAVYRSKNTAFGGAPPRLLIARRDCSTCRLYNLEFIADKWTECVGFTMTHIISTSEAMVWRTQVLGETRAMYAHPGCRPFLDTYKEKPEDQARFLAFGDYLDENNLFPHNLAAIRAIQAGRQPPPYTTSPKCD